MLMIEKESSAKAFLKSASSKPNSSKTDSLRAIKDEKDQEFESCTRTATTEIKRFHQKRLIEMKDTLVTYTEGQICLLYTSPSPRDRQKSRMPSSA